MSLRGADALAPGDLDPTFKIGLGGNSPILTLAINQTNGSMYIGGRFTKYNEMNVSRFAVLNPNGSLNLTWWDQIKGFNQPGANDNVNIVTLDNQGRVLIGGRFGTFFGKSIKNLVRLNPDGTLDTTFNDGTITGFGPNDEVTSIFVTSDDKVLIAGQFTSYNDGTQTLTRNQMVRLNADMTIDTTFDPGFGAETTSGSPIGTIVQQPDGKILIGGEFTRFQNTAVGRITRLNTDGTLDTSFNPSGAGLASGNIREIELLPDGRIVAVGNIVSYNGTATDHFIRLSSTGVLDTSFQPTVSAQIRSVEVQANGQYLIVGDFRTVGAANLPRPSLARINVDGTPDTVLNSGVGTARTPESPNTLDIVYAGKLDPNDFLVLVGDFTHWNTIENVNRITRIATDNVTVTNAVAPTISAQPQSQTVCVGDSKIAFSVTADGTAPLTYQWSKNGAAIAGATAATYTISTVAEADAGSYTVTVSNSEGSTNSAAAVLLVQTPPTIATQPQSTSVATGGSFTLTVAASGTSPFTYQWFKDGAALSGATASSYSADNVFSGDAGSYSVIVSNACGFVTSSTATVTVAPPNTPPTVSIQPQTQTVCAGTNVTLSVSATGTTPFTYQWFKDGVAVSGATSQSLSFTAIATTDAGSYTVTIANAAGSATSSVAVLTVLTPASVLTQPQSANVVDGGAFTLSVTAAGSAPLTYQWFRNGAAIGGATGASYTVASASSGDAGAYTVTVSNACGAVSSSSVTVTLVTPPTIVGHPLPQQVKEGSSALFNVVALGDSPFTYQWFKDGVAVSGATAQTLLLSGVTDASAGFYSVQVANNAGSATSTNALLTILKPPVITTPPQTQTVLQGNTLTLSAGVTGTAPLAYQWKLNGVDISGANSATLSIANVQTANAGSYTVFVSNICAVATSQAATVTVGVPPTVNSGGQPVTQTVCEGTNVSFTVSASGSATLTYQWSLNGAPIAGANSATLVLAGVTTANAGAYTVTVANAYGSVTSSAATLTVQTPPTIVTQPLTQTVLQGNTLTLSVAATGTAPFTYQWKLNGAAVSGGTGATLTVANIQESQAGSYTVDVSNVCGTATSQAATVTVGVPPTVNSGGQPVTQTVCEGTNVVMAVSGSGSAPLGYQWYLNGSPVSGATSATLVIPLVDTVHAGLYTAQISNPYGTATSSGALLTVQTPPSILVAPQATTIVRGDTLTLSVAAGGTAPLSFQWKLNGVVIAGATNSALSIANVQVAQAGIYTVEISNPCATTSSTGVQVTVGVPPAITGEPQDQEVIVGGTAVFAPTITGDGPCTFQWRKNGVNLPGATSQTLTLVNAQESDEAGYSLLITCPYGSVVSRTATLTVRQPPIIITNPMDVSVIAGNPATFTVAASGDPTLTYQWFKNGVLIAGATNTALVILNAQDADEGGYSAVATNPYGTATSSAATLTVNNPPSITAQPQPQVVLEGTTAAFTVGYIGDGACTFQWRRNGVAIPGATSQTLNITNSRKTDEASYSVVITCPFGSATSQGATLTVNRPPVIVIPPTSQTVLAGTPATFTVTANGDPTLVYQWQKNGTNIPGATALAYVIASAQKADEGLYSVVVTNAFGAATSTAATLTVNKAPVITGQPQPQEVIEGNTATFTVTVDADGPCTYQWRFKGVNIQQTSVPTLTLTNAQRTQQGDYSVVVNCPYGTATSDDARLTVRIPPAIVTHPLSQTVVQGFGVLFTAVATGDPTLRYQWSLDGFPLVGATNTFLLLNNVQSTNAGSYAVVVTNLYGTATSSNAVLSVKLPPVVTTPPQTQTVVVGQPASFTVSHTGDGPCTYQWMKDGVAIPGGNSITLTIPSSQLSDQASYSVLISCAFGSVTSPSARLTVNEPPTIVLHPVSQKVVIGNSVAFSGAAVGTPTLFYQWYKDGIAIQGATSTLLTLANVGSNDVANYSFVVTNAYGSATSSNATLALSYPPVIIDQPQGLTRPVGSSATFTVGVAGDGPCTYQWRKDGVVITGATNASYTIPAVVKADEADYSVVVTCAFGTVTSDNAPLLVTEPPRIIFHPISEHVIIGTNAVISVLAEGTETLTYQWYYQQTVTTTPVGTPLAGYTLPTLHLASVDRARSGAYYCIVSNSLGSETSQMATITVLDPNDLSSGGGATQRTFAAPVVSNGQITLQFSTADGSPATSGGAAGIVVQGSTNLVVWSAVAATINVVNGNYQIVLNDPGSLSHRFYRVIYP